MEDQLDEEMLVIFCDEVKDLLALWESECLALEKDMENPHFDGLFRIAHNIKGSSKAMGLNEFGNFVHKLEDVIGLLKEKEIFFDHSHIDFLLEGQKVMSEWSEILKDDSSFFYNTKPLMLKAQSFIDVSVGQSKDLEEEEKGPKDFGTVAVMLGEAEIQDVEKASRIQKRKIGEIMVDEGMIKPDAIPKILEEQSKGNPKASTMETIRVTTDKIDKLLQLIGELSIHQSVISHSYEKNTLDSLACQNAVKLGNKVSKEIQEHGLSLRMVPLKQLFQRLERTVRDLARKQEKEIDVIIDGAEVDLDKTISEKIADPLTHIVRNAIDHGIENKNTRIEVGKNPKASIFISAKQDPTGVIITIADDGKGLNSERIKNKAIEKGIITKDHKLSEKEIHRLILNPGFSTAEKITDVSGRGVGMDVVKQTVKMIGGDLLISSEENKGTTFDIILPTSLSILDGLIIKLGGVRYIVPLLELSEIIDLSKYHLEKTDKKKAMINLRGKIVPVEDLKNFFPLSMTKEKDCKEKSNENKRPALIVEIEERKVAFLVDEVEEQRQIVVRPLNKKLSKIPGIDGGSIFANGETGMIITIRKLAQSYLEKH